MKRLLLLAGLVLCVSRADARDAEGRLDRVLAPNSTLPAIVSRGGEFDVLLRQADDLRIESAAGSFPLRVSPPRRVRGLVQLRATVGAEVPAGSYTMVARGGDGEDRAYRSVFVLEAPPVEYRVAVWSNLRIAADPQKPDSALFRVSAELNAGNPDLIVITGNLTAAGTPEQFRLALDILNECAAPTLVALGPADLAAGRAEAYLGPRPAATRFGPDAYLLLPAQWSDGGGELGRLHLERRRVRASRWSIGAGLGESGGDGRAALVILVDDPLDAILGTPWDGAEAPANPRSPWGRTRLFAAPPERAALEWFTVGPRGFEANTPQH